MTATASGEGPQRTPPAELLAWLREHVDPREVRAEPGQDGRAHTWCVVARQGTFYARYGLSPRKVEQESRVVRMLEPRFSAMPRTLAHDPEHGAFLREARPGRPDPADPAAWIEAGRALRHLHDLSVADTDRLSVASALERRLSAALQHLRSSRAPLGNILMDADFNGVIGDGLRAWSEAGLPAGRRWCHRDYQPANWLWDSAASTGRRLHIVDWEHARLDAACLDIGKVSTAKPGLWTAFCTGYGPIPETARDLALLMHGLGTLVRGLRNDDDAVVQEGRAVLAFRRARGRPRRRQRG